METLKDVEMRLEFCNSSEPVIKYDQEKVRQRYLEQRKNLAILQYILGKTPTDDFQGKMDKNRKNQANIFLCNENTHKQSDSEIQDENSALADEISVIQSQIGNISLEELQNLITFAEQKNVVSTIDEHLKISAEKLEAAKKQLEEQEAEKDNFSGQCCFEEINPN